MLRAGRDLDRLERLRRRLPELTGAGDPVVLYDQLANRWLITQFAGTTRADRRVHRGLDHE